MDLSDLRVLVVDDHPDVAESIARLLEQYGAAARFEFDANRIVDIVRDFRPTLVLLDIGLPGIDGWEACRRIRLEKGIEVFVAAITGWNDDFGRERSQKVGFDAHLVKPVSMECLRQLAILASKALKNRSGVSSAGATTT